MVAWLLGCLESSSKLGWLKQKGVIPRRKHSFRQPLVDGMLCALALLHTLQLLQESVPFPSFTFFGKIEWEGCAQ